MSRVPMRMSQQAAMAAPPPVQAPEMAAIIGTGQRSMRRQDLVDPRLVVETVLGRAEVAELGYVGSGRKRLAAGASDDDGPHGAIARLAFRELCQPRIHGKCQCIVLLGPVRA